MVDVLVIIGSYTEWGDIYKRAIPYRLPQVPAIGDRIVPDDELNRKIAAQAKEWDMVSDCVALNYVHAIAYTKERIIVQLGANPKLFTIDLIYGDRIRGSYLEKIPNIGDSIFVKDFKENELLYVKRVYYSAHSRVVNIELSDKQELPWVNVANRVDVYVENTVDVNVGNTPLDIRNYSRY